MRKVNKIISMETINLFFIGDRFYIRSGSVMSPIYVVDTKERYDWGFVNVALQEGKEIQIRPATSEEMIWAKKKLAELKKKKV